jgi:hypothetical protein
MENHGGLNPWLGDQRRKRSTVDQPPWPAIELDGARPSGRCGARWLTGGGTTGRGVHGKSISSLTGVRAAVWWPDDGSEEMVVGAPWHRWERGGSTSAGLGWRREGERDLQPVGWLGMLAARRVGPKATRPKGRTGQQGGWAGTEEKCFLK